MEELLAADRAFAAASARTDVVSGLSPMFADSVAMPMPNGKFSANAAEAIEALRSNPDNARSGVDWTPIRAGISADGMHGFTLGTMKLRQPDGTIQPLKYISYWIKGPQGWRVVAYKRAKKPDPAELATMAPALPARMVTPSQDHERLEELQRSLASAEQSFSDEAQKIGLMGAFARYGSADAVNMGGPGDSGFILGADAISRAVTGGNTDPVSPVSWGAERVLVASSGDFGVTFGMIRRNGGTPGDAGRPFFTIWRRAGVNEPWRYVAE